MKIGGVEVCGRPGSPKQAPGQGGSQRGQRRSAAAETTDSSRSRRCHTPAARPCEASINFDRIGMRTRPDHRGQQALKPSGKQTQGRPWQADQTGGKDQSRRCAPFAPDHHRHRHLTRPAWAGEAGRRRSSQGDHKEAKSSPGFVPDQFIPCRRQAAEAHPRKPSESPRAKGKSRHHADTHRAEPSGRAVLLARIGGVNQA